VNRDLRRLASAEFDVLVVGGGIYGLAAGYDAAQRGLTVALIDRGDFGAATSFNHLKTIHGGLRYLQTGDLFRMRDSICERRTIARIAPRFVAPLAFVMSTSKQVTRTAWALKTAMTIDRLVGFDRNSGLPASHRLPAGRILNAAQAKSKLSGFMTEPPSGAAEWYDYEAVEGDRLTLAFALAAGQSGATLANYVKAAEMSSTGGLHTVAAHDVVSGDRFTIRARSVINATGPWSPGWLAKNGIGASRPMLKAMNLVTSRAAPAAALVAPTPSGRALVVLPWKGRCVIGTSESVEERNADDQDARQAEVREFIKEINDTFTGLRLSDTEVTLVHRGIVPAVRRSGRLGLVGHAEVIDHGRHGHPGLISIVGVKYTTARAVGEQAVTLLLKSLNRPAVGCRTAQTLLPGASLNEPAISDPIAHAIAHEMAQTLTDVVVRRTGLGAAGYPGNEVVAKTADQMQQMCGWTEQRRQMEIAALKGFYEIR